MKSIIGLALIFLTLCFSKQGASFVRGNVKGLPQNQSINIKDSLFTIDIKENGALLTISAPKTLSFSLPDSSIQIIPFKQVDFNADGKEDVMVYLGACGTGGCMYALFLNQYDNLYKLAFMDYLKNADFEVDQNGVWIIHSYEEAEPYNPSKLFVSVFKFNNTNYNYELDTTFIYQEK